MSHLEELVALRAALPAYVPALVPSRAPGARIGIEVPEGVILVGSDAHYRPGGYVSTAHLALREMCVRLAPAALIMNGDVLDGPRISRHPAGDWDDFRGQPTVVDEVAECQARLRELYKATPEALHLWTLGNHDARFEAHLVKQSPEYIGIHGTRLRDHFPDWRPAMSVHVNPDSPHPFVVKHRWKSGKHAVFNNTIGAGTSMVTGHLHALKVEPFSDYRGTRWGVDCGTLAPLYGPQFLYAEDAPQDWRSGFAVLTFRDGLPLWPEVCYVVEEEARLYSFRGEMYQAEE